jgi:hypothetical protein
MKRHIITTMMIPHIAIAMMIIGVLLQPLPAFWEGYIDILTSTSILLTDYIAVSGVGPTLFNAGSLMLLSYIIVKKLSLPITGSIFAGLFTILGFAFFGKNLLNVSIMYLGVTLYAKYSGYSARSVIVVFLFATGLSPISSIVMFGMDLDLWIGIPLGIIVGVTSGFLLMELSRHTMIFHKGYNLYNVGFASGIVAFVLFSIFSLSGATYETNFLYSNDSHIFLLVFFIVVSVFYLVLGLYLNNWTFRGYKSILQKGGRIATDFTQRNQHGPTMINIGITSLASLVVIVALQVHMNGPIIGGLFTIMGFAAFGKHIRNILPPMFGVGLIVVLFGLELTVPIILSILFVTGVAPLAGEYGIFIGVLSGMVHLPIVISLGQLLGGVLLYANGFAAAFTAVFINTIIQSFKRREDIWLYTKK